MLTRFDFTRFLEDQFGTPDGVVAYGSKFNVELPARDTVRKWFERGRVSGEWVPALIALAGHVHGSPVDVSPYFISPEEADIFG